MQTIVTIIAVAINPFRHVYSCACGAQRVGRKSFIKHIASHRNQMGAIDHTSGKVTF